MKKEQNVWEVLSRSMHWNGKLTSELSDEQQEMLEQAVSIGILEVVEIENEPLIQSLKNLIFVLDTCWDRMDEFSRSRMKTALSSAMVSAGNLQRYFCGEEIEWPRSKHVTWQTDK